MRDLKWKPANAYIIWDEIASIILVFTPKKCRKNKFGVLQKNRVDIYLIKGPGKKIKHKTGAEN